MSEPTNAPPFIAPRTQRESPEHATHTSLPRMYTTFDVVPHVIAVWPSGPPRRSRSILQICVCRHAAGSALSASWFASSISGIDFMQNSDAFSPFEPWPSKMHSSAWL